VNIVWHHHLRRKRSCMSCNNES